jgi:hypothetical protein
MESSLQNMPEHSFISKDVLQAADRALEQMIARVDGNVLFEELGLGYDVENPMYISEDASRLPVVVHQMEKDGKTYFLGYTKE